MHIRFTNNEFMHVCLDSVLIASPVTEDFAMSGPACDQTNFWRKDEVIIKEPAYYTLSTAACDNDCERKR